MRPTRAFLPLLLSLLLAPAALAQNWGEIEGTVTEAGGGAIPGANVLIDGTNFGTAANADGEFGIRLPTGRYLLRVTAVGFETREDSVVVRKDETTRYDVALAPVDVQMDEVLVEGDQTATEVGVSTLDPRTAQDIPTPLNDGFRAVKVLLGVTSSTETSYQYSVRGGGYNENLYFIDGFEVFTPFRTRQGEQEGLGLVNLDMAAGLTLYAGGFPARYGGKLASALLVDYLRPQQGWGGSAYASGLDAGASVYGATPGGRLGVALAARSARPRGFFGSQELKGDYDPVFTDVQGTATYRLADGHELQALGFYLNHRFKLDPRQRTTFFGSFDNLRSVSFAYSGFEEDGYDLGFGGLRLVNRLSDRVRVEHDVSYFDVIEFEQYEVSGNVALFRIDPFEDPDNPEERISTGAATQSDFADNRIRVGTLAGGGRYRLAAGRHAAEAGWTLRRLAFEDSLNEGSTLFGRNEDGGPDSVVQALTGSADFTETQAGLYLQDTVDLLKESGKLVITGGVRADYFSFNEEWTVSPRLSARYELNPVTTLTAAAGVYHQAPTYRELRGEPIFSPASQNLVLDALNRDLRSQRSTQLVVGAERFFPSVRFYGRAEAYYKAFDNLVSYDVENVRTVYSGENDAEGTTYGFDLQLRGEFVPGLESWLNYGFLVSNERFFAPGPDATPEELEAFEQRGGGSAVARPTDRRHNLSLFVQDYVPGSESWRLHMRALFGSGTPYTAPEPGAEIGGVELQDPGPRASSRYPEYRRFDMGVTKEAVLTPSGPAGRPVTLELTGEVLNVFDMTNTIDYDWIAGSDGVWQRIPTRLTPRQVNVRLRVRF